MLYNRISAGWREGVPALTEDLSRILAIRLDNIGDMVMLSPALKSLRAAYPQAEITLMASQSGSQVAPLLPWINDLITWRATWQEVSGKLPFDPQRELTFIEELRQRQFSAAFIFTSFTQSPYPPAYLCYLAGIPIRVGHSKEFGGEVLSHSVEPPLDSGHQSERNLSLLRSVGLPLASHDLELFIPETDGARALRILESIGIPSGSPFIALAPGASCNARRYDPGRFNTVIQMLTSVTKLPVVLLGSLKEFETISPVFNNLDRKTTRRVRSLIGETTVSEMAAIISRASLVIANNSAALHFADAFRRPMVILYSGTEYESQWRPRQAPANLLRRPTPCSPCYSFNCPFQMECLDIPPEEVVEAALGLLAMEVFSAEPRGSR